MSSADLEGKGGSSWGVHRFHPVFETPKHDIPKVKEDGPKSKTWDAKSLCVRTIATEREFDELQRSAERTDQLMVVKYVRKDCPACHVVSAGMEKLCKKYLHYGYVKFYEVTESRTPELMARAPKTPHVDAHMGASKITAELNFAPPVEIRREAQRRVENLNKVEEAKGAVLSREEKQKMMMSQLIPPTMNAGDQSLMDALMDFNQHKAQAYFAKPTPPV